MNNPRFDNEMVAAFLRGQNDLVQARGGHPRGRGPREHISSRVWSPVVDVREDNEAITIIADLPGMKQEDIDIELTDDTLTIKGERKFEDETRRDNYIRVERQYGAFQRSFTIGVPIESNQVRATYRNGTLELTLPKAEATKPKKVQVTIE